MKKFTLLELMIVIAIIGILVSILLPSLWKAREAARNALCMSNIRQLATGLILYCKNSNNFFPDTERAGKYDKRNWSWAGNSMLKRNGLSRDDDFDNNGAANRPLNKYLGWQQGNEMEFLNCPSDNSLYNSHRDYSFEGKYSWYRMFGTSYSINKHPGPFTIGRDDGGPSRKGPQTLSAIREPSRMVMASGNDGNNAINQPTFWNVMGNQSASEAENGWVTIDQHRNYGGPGVRSNVVKADLSGTPSVPVVLNLNGTDLWDNWKWSEDPR